MQIRFFLAALLLPLMMNSCADKKQEKRDTTPSEQKKKVYTEVSHIQEPKENARFTLGDPVNFLLQTPDSIQSDSAVISADKTILARLGAQQYEVTIDSKSFQVGRNQFRIEIYLDNGHKERHYRTLIFKSDLTPDKLKCRIVKTYPHDPGAYTQGLFFKDGFLYEGTGQRGESSLRKVDLESGELINALGLPAQYFGEGIASYKDKIIQLTWTSRTGFVYDKDEFKLLNKVRYPTQGWGLTSDGEKLFMSDGTSTIYFLDPEFFTELGQIQVYDHKGPVQNLNELEYIDGKVYANVWQKDYIISFDPETGKVLEKIDCSNLVPDKYKNDRDLVLNGIAYDKEKGRILMTGKRWSKLYHVEFTGR